MQRVCMVIPCYNEENRLPVQEFEQFYSTSDPISFCFVNDGSTDGTLALLRRLQQGRENRIQVLDLPHNMGKAEAVRNAVLNVATNGDFEAVAYFDADFATPLDQIYLLAKAMRKRPESQMVFGSRVKLMGRVIERSPKRHYLGRVFATLASNILGLAVYDTQCGAKLIRSDLAREIFTENFISSWLFDVEILARIVRKYGHQKAEEMLVEVPLQIWLEKGGSKLGLKHMMRVPLELFQIHRKYFAGR